MRSPASSSPSSSSAWACWCTFAGIGASLVLAGKPIVSPETYAAAVFMVVVATMATPPLLLWSLKRDGAAARAWACPGAGPGA